MVAAFSGEGRIMEKSEIWASEIFASFIRNLSTCKFSANPVFFFRKSRIFSSSRLTMI